MFMLGSTFAGVGEFLFFSYHCFLTRFKRMFHWYLLFMGYRCLGGGGRFYCAEW